MESNRTYYERRAAEERSAAMSASGRAREAHMEMARRYDERLRSAEVAERRAAMHAVGSEATSAA